MEAAQERKNTVQERMDAAQDCIDPYLERLSQVSSAGTVGKHLQKFLNKDLKYSIYSI